MQGLFSPQRGNTLLIVLVLGAVLSSGFAFLTNQILTKNQQFRRNVSDVKSQMVLNSFLDYATHALKQRWCLSSSFVPDSNCRWDHPNNLERLIVTEEQEQLLRDLEDRGLLSDPLPAGQVMINEVSFTLNTSMMSGTHPLAPIMSQLSSDDFSNFRVTFVRNRSKDNPVIGQGVFVDIIAEVLDSGGQLITIGNNPLRAKSALSMHQRELTSFALVAPRDLRLDGVTQSGALTFPSVTPNETMGANYGVIFESPVYVNRDIYLLQDSGAGAGAMAPIIFADRVVQGSGVVRTQSGPYQPPRDQQLWSESQVFGGFLKGLDLDGASDEGMDYFLRLLPPEAPLGSQAMQECSELTQKRNSSDRIQDAKLIAEVKSYQALEASYRFGFDNGNEFSPQSISLGTINDSNWNGTVTRSVTSGSQDPVMRMDVIVGDSRVQMVRMPMNGELRLEYQNLIPNAPNAQIVIQTVGVQFGGTSQPHLQDVRVSIINSDALRGPPQIITPPPPSEETEGGEPPVDAGEGGGGGEPVEPVEPPPAEPEETQYIPGSLLPVNIQILAYDLTYFNGYPIKGNGGGGGFGGGGFGGGGPSSSQTDNIRVIKANVVEEAHVLGNGIYQHLTSIAAMNSQVSESNLGELAETCANQGSFIGASWGESFAPQTRNSWNFAGTGSTNYQDPLISEFIFDGNNSTLTTTRFQVRSIVGTCRVRSTARFITGFLACDNLVIEPRSQPLRIIGTIIAGNLEIDPSAYNAGIRWSSIYHPQAVAELRLANVLGRRSGASCDTIGVPLWHPLPSLADAQDRFNCSPLSLRAQADPFQWTTVDPDCGVLPGGTTTSCKRRVNRFFLVEHSREYGL